MCVKHSPTDSKRFPNFQFGHRQSTLREAAAIEPKKVKFFPLRHCPL